MSKLFWIRRAKAVRKRLVRQNKYPGDKELPVNLFINDKLLGEWLMAKPIKNEIEGFTGRVMSLRSFYEKYKSMGLKRKPDTLYRLVAYGILSGYVTREVIEATGRNVRRTYIEDTEQNVELAISNLTAGTYFKHVRAENRSEYRSELADALMFPIRQGWIDVRDYEVNGRVHLGAFFPIGTMADMGLIALDDMMIVRAIVRRLFKDWASQYENLSELQFTWTNHAFGFYPVEFTPTLFVKEHFLSVRKYKGGFYRFSWIPDIMRKKKRHSFEYHISFPPKKEIIITPLQ